MTKRRHTVGFNESDLWLVVRALDTYADMFLDGGKRAQKRSDAARRLADRIYDEALAKKDPIR